MTPMNERARAHRFLPLSFERVEEAEQRRRATALRASLASRRSVRAFSDEHVALDVVDACIAIAGSAPSGANRQPWTFVVVTDPGKKRAIRLAAEEEERKSYSERMNDEWLAALEPLGTTYEKPFLETAPALIVVFRHAYGVEPGPYSVSGDVAGEAGEEHDAARGRTYQNYYTHESVGIACGFLISALHQVGLATLTHTPSPMGFLARILERPANERAYLLLPVGRPARDCVVPDIARKPLDAIRVRV